MTENRLELRRNKKPHQGYNEKEWDEFLSFLFTLFYHFQKGFSKFITLTLDFYVRVPTEMNSCGFRRNGYRMPPVASHNLMPEAVSPLANHCVDLERNHGLKFKLLYRDISP